MKLFIYLYGTENCICSHEENSNFYGFFESVSGNKQKNQSSHIPKSLTIRIFAICFKI